MESESWTKIEEAEEAFSAVKANDKKPKNLRQLLLTGGAMDNGQMVHTRNLNARKFIYINYNRQILGSCGLSDIYL